MFENKIYNHSPIFLQNILLSTRALARKLLRENKKNKHFLDTIMLLERSEEALDKFSTNALKNALENASMNCPYYQGKVELEQFNYLSKTIIQENEKSFRNKFSNGISVSGSTTGTTGSPLKIPQDMGSVLKEQAFISRHLTWAGFKPGDKRAWLRGDTIVPIGQKKAPFWRYSYFEDMILLSSFHMTAQALPQYIQAMIDYKVDIIQAYPSSIVILAKYLEANNQYYPGRLKSIITSSESLIKADKLLVESRFKCTVFDWYGLFERVAAIASCEEGRYHILTDYAHVELLPDGEVDGKLRAEIVGTNFNNTLYPLIRYKTGDHVILSNEKKCPCGRVYPLIDSIDGRNVDFVIADDDTLVYALSRCSKGVEGLLGCQYIQYKRGELTVMAIITNVFTEKQKSILIANIKRRLGDSMLVEVVSTDNLIRSKGGKIRQSICMVEG